MEEVFAQVVAQLNQVEPSHAFLATWSSADACCALSATFSATYHTDLPGTPFHLMFYCPLMSLRSLPILFAFTY